MHERSTFFDKNRVILSITTVVMVGDVDRSKYNAQAKAHIQTFPKRPWHGLMFQIAGQISYFYGDEEYIVREGDVMYFAKGHAYKALTTKSPCICCCVNFQISEQDDTAPKVYRLENPESIRRLFENLNLQWIKGENHFLCMKTLYEIIANIYVSENSCYASPKRRERFCEAREYIANHYTDPTLSPSVVANALGISTAYLRKLFSRFAMMSPQEYIISIRIRCAKDLLKTEPLSIAAIAEMVGFFRCCLFFQEIQGYCWYFSR